MYAGTTTVISLVVSVVAVVAFAIAIFLIIYCKFRRSVCSTITVNCLQVTLYRRPLACLVPSKSRNKTMSFHNEIEKQENNSYYDLPEDLIINVSNNVIVINLLTLAQCSL